jgi:hypothetical protein
LWSEQRLQLALTTHVNYRKEVKICKNSRYRVRKVIEIWSKHTAKSVINRHISFKILLLSWIVLLFFKSLCFFHKFDFLEIPLFIMHGLIFETKMRGKFCLFICKHCDFFTKNSFFWAIDGLNTRLFFIESSNCVLSPRTNDQL